LRQTWFCVSIGALFKIKTYLDVPLILSTGPNSIYLSLLLLSKALGATVYSHLTLVMNVRSDVKTDIFGQPVPKLYLGRVFSYRNILGKLGTVKMANSGHIAPSSSF
jgi:hypothetical protein